MMHKHLLALLQNGFTTIECVFIREDGMHTLTGKRYTYKAKLTDNVLLADVVVVNSPTNGLSLCLVVAVHHTPKIDLDAPFTYKWIVQKIDQTAHNVLLEQEANFMEMMMEVERVRQRELLLEQFKTHLPEGSDARKLFDNATKVAIAA